MQAFIRFAPLSVGLTLATVGVLFGLTDWAWRLEGSPSESYPEIFFLGIVTPVGLIVAALGGIWSWAFGRRARR
jgi:hypothetical protein